MNQINKWSISFIERGNTKMMHITLTGPQSYDEVVDFFGLNKDNILWFDIINMTNFQASL